MREFDGRVGHLEGIESPWANAGGVVKTLDDVELMAHTGVGWIEAGSYTLEPRVGNSPNGERVYYHNPETGETFNSLGMPNWGMDVVETELPEMAQIAHAHHKLLVVNVAPVSEDPATESVELVRRAQVAGADMVLLNAGCPNVVTDDGGRHELLSRSPEAFMEVMAALKKSGVDTIAVRISPQENLRAVQEICDIIKYSNIVSVVFTPNTYPGPGPIDEAGNPIIEVKGNIAGKSGPAMLADARLQAYYAAVALKSSFTDVVSSGSITTGRELDVRLSLDAVAGAGTTFFYESQNGWKEDVDRLLSEFASLQ